MSRLGRLLPGSLLLLLLLTGCGVPTTGAPRAISSAEIPISLPSPVTNPGDDSARRLALFFLDAGKLKVNVRPVDRRQSPAETLDKLLAGPNETESSAGATTRLTGVTLERVEAAPDGVATVTLSGQGVQQLTAEAVAQIVFTLVPETATPTSVRAVRFRFAGKDLQVPDDAGAVTLNPVDRGDYRDLVASPAPTAPSSTPLPLSAPVG